MTMTTLIRDGLAESTSMQTALYQSQVSKAKRSLIGQFFTDDKTAEYMASMIVPSTREISILDMGAGSGILSEKAVMRCVANGATKIKITAAENDGSILPLLKDTLQKIERYCRNNHASMEYKIVTDNYLLYADDSFYDIVISNPPYKKIRKNAPEATAWSSYVCGQPNLYSLFMAAGISRLKPNGQYVYIVPRSWTSGKYYKSVRTYIADSTKIDHLLLFKSRRDSFGTDDILQETMIVHGVNQHISSGNVSVDIVNDYSFSSINTLKLPLHAIVQNTQERYVCIPENEFQAAVLLDIEENGTTLSDAGYIFKTGPVVEFRNSGILSADAKAGYVPMLRGLNILPENKFVFPVQTRKYQYISKQAENLLLPNSITVLTRRLSTKESPVRIQACVYYPVGNSEFISIENHVNYLCRKDGKALTAQEAENICRRLSSQQYDAYFRMIGGSTQVNATDLNNLPWGEKERDNNMPDDTAEYKYQVLNDAQHILDAIGMPKQLQNRQSVLIFAACAHLTKPEWKRVSEEYSGTHDMIQFINKNFPKKAGHDKTDYQENSRESFRKKTLKPWVDAGILERKPGLSANDRNNAYRFTSEFAGMVRKYGTDEWEDALNAYKSIHESYARQLRQIRDIAPGNPVNYGGINLNLGSGKHNKLQKVILDRFAPLFSPGAELLYIGDASNRMLHINEERLKELGINVFTDSTALPDVVLYDAAKDRVLFIEAYVSTGEFSFARVKQILSMCNTNSDISFVTAFLTTATMLKTYASIAWDTDIWVAEDETHLTHKNGDRYLGRKKKDFVI